MIINAPLGVQGEGGGHTILPTPDVNLTEDDVATAVNAAAGDSEDIPSLFGIQNWSNTVTKRFIFNDGIPAGATGIGTWVDGEDWEDLQEMSNSDINF